MITSNPISLSRLFFCLLVSFAITGCFESRKNTDQLCQKEPGLQCEALNMNDGQCKIPRTDLIWHRHQTLEQPSEEGMITEYHILKRYQKCLELAAQMRSLDQKDKESKRFNALMYVIEERTRIEESLVNSRSASTLYFLWSETGNQPARRQFLALEGTPELETAEMQYALATYYISRDKTKTYELLNRSLELSKHTTPNKDAIKALASVSQQLGRHKLSYLWTKVGQGFGIATASESELDRMFALQPEEYQELDIQAEQIISTLKEGRYSRQ
ncbi:DUF2989 domain-containing protein [Vibrio hippocampi]|uniref:DUF2989 domain-containing protein n=1 Tax=Vibrio hippocampi TaxID=654686 RepID=A0ABN8DIG9_9VIBR|nr:DUF2989 domain-containing protein [Vibrio hippocampi]CAH0526546.1 hypothetical protein VHP8226_01900 [Vibrio hippocampi]